MISVSLVLLTLLACGDRDSGPDDGGATDSGTPTGDGGGTPTGDGGGTPTGDGGGGTTGDGGGGTTGDGGGGTTGDGGGTTGDGGGTTGDGGGGTTGDGGGTTGDGGGTTGDGGGTTGDGGGTTGDGGKATPETETDCSDGRDDDEDGLLDCEDLDCLEEAHCKEDCDNSTDDDSDSLIDCEDPDCAFTHPCALTTIDSATGTWTYRDLDKTVYYSYGMGASPGWKPRYEESYRFDLRDVEGTIVSPAGGTCRWGADRIVRGGEWEFAYYSYTGLDLVESSSGMWTDGCGDAEATIPSLPYLQSVDSEAGTFIACNADLAWGSSGYGLTFGCSSTKYGYGMYLEPTLSIFGGQMSGYRNERTTSSYTREESGYSYPTRERLREESFTIIAVDPSDWSAE